MSNNLEDLDHERIIASIGKVKLGINLQKRIPYRVYIIDDDVLQRSLLKRFLVKFGFEIQGEAGDGEDALNALSKLTSDFFPDIICIDQEMPHLKGTETVPNLQKKFPKAKILMISAHSGKVLVREIVRLRINGYILKPIEPFVVFVKLSGILNRPELLEGHLTLKSKVIDIDKINIPPLSPVITKILSFDIENPENGIQEFEKIILPDSTISIFLLKIANSSFYSHSKRVSTLREALNIIGIKNSKKLILIELNKSINKKLVNPTFITHLRTMPIINSLITYDLESPLGLKKIHEDIFTIVLLRKIGMNILALNFPDEYLKILRLADYQVHSIYQLEENEFGMNSIQLGKKVFKTWNLPEDYINLLSKQNFTIKEIGSVNDLDRIARLGEILSKQMLQLTLTSAELELKSEIFKFYKIPQEVILLFNEEYFETIQDHPFLDMVNY